ncbi:hypothetical protein PG996_015820 [Apiospora saccharicola]|uniref:AB hydrolase-1 domain-containing protein n=1 Tax=Apiospora saccharicola TaxID=335842 RepID=A0ABR1TM71_9PEZI
MGLSEKVEFKTLDGLVLRGFLYCARAKGPAIVMTPGFNFPVSLLYHEVALGFQEAGITALVYDPRSVGRSDGLPRSDINPAKQSEDFSDAITFLKTKSVVDPKRIALWGYSLSAAAALMAAGLDPRVKLVVAVCPAPVPYNFEVPGKRRKYLDLAVRDRESQARGKEPFYVQYIGDSEETALFDYRKQRGMEDLEYDAVVENLSKIAPGFRNEVTIQTLRRLGSWSFADVPQRVGAIPVLQVFAIHEELQHIRKTQEAIWNGLAGPKERHTEDRGHMDILTPDGHRFAHLVKVQVDFVLKNFSQRMR